MSEEERASRRRVIISLDDPRLQEAKFKEAVVVVANNDARYQINKDMSAVAMFSSTTRAYQLDGLPIHCGPYSYIPNAHHVFGQHHGLLPTTPGPHQEWAAPWPSPGNEQKI